MEKRKSETVIVVIDDLLKKNDPIIIRLSEQYEKIELFKSPAKGLKYLKGHLDQKNIVLLDYVFSTHDPNGNEVLKTIREMSMLIPVIIFTANGSQITEFQDLINNHAFAFVPQTDTNEIIKKVKEAEVEIQNSVEGALEEWIELQGKEKRSKPYLITADGKELTLDEILKEIRQQTETGQRFEKDLLSLTIDLLLRKKENL